MIGTGGDWKNGIWQSVDNVAGRRCLIVLLVVGADWWPASTE